ncbi:MAG TPA: hypothetical protein VH186_05980 [Chloroflexia bacterium]|nr:hypothetical protein [Chloroflexia bacterium]
MDTFNRDFGKENETDTEFAYPANDFSSGSNQARVPNAGFGFGLLKALRMNAQNTETTAAPVERPLYDRLNDTGAEFAGFVAPKTAYVEPAPVYKGEYKHLCPLYFNTEPVDNANDTRLDRSKLAGYSRAQLFFLLRLERFLRLRHYWLDASPRQDEQWKTDLIMRSVYSAYRDCVKHEVGEDGKILLSAWGCC